MEEDKDLLKFEKLAKYLQVLIKDRGLILNLSGYKNFMLEYYSMIQCDIETSSKISKEAIFWSDYFSEIRNILNLVLMDMGIEMNVLLINNVKNKKKILILKQEMTMLKLFLRQLSIQKNLCIKIFFWTLKNFRKSYDELNFYS